MLPDGHVWIFNGPRGNFPSAVFATRETAERWIQANKVTGVLTAYPLDEGVFDWAVRMGFVSDRVKPRGKDPMFIAGFSSASQEHFHYENGAPADAAEG
jgi:hypothetical protein